MALDIAGRYRYPAPNLAWLERHREAIIEPELAIVDAHHHIWDEPGKPYLLDDLLVDLDSGHHIVATVFVQCHYAYREQGPEHLRPVGETLAIEAVRREALRRRPQARACAAIVGFADMLADEAKLEELLEAHLAASPDHFRGVRQSVARDSHFPDGIVLRAAPAGMLADARFRRGLAQVAARGLSFDLLLYHEQIPELTALAHSMEQATIILDHYGCPLGVGHYRSRTKETFAQWQRDIVQLAACPNVHIKLGGLGMIIMGAEYHLGATPPSSVDLANAWRPYVETAVNAFGTQRCLFESNFPVDKAMFSYTVLWNAFKRLSSGASASEKADLFRNNAARLYRLEKIGD